jgi:ABC-type Mn2+/Zn2+ transport system ATPase subunit
MRLKSVYISQYKNLKDFTLTFDNKSSIDVFVGKNGTGKSNLFEALIEIFRHISEYKKDKTEIDFEYSVAYEIKGKEKKISFYSGQLTINGKTYKNIGKTLFPDNVLIYYSGHNKAVSGLVQKCEEAFRKQIKGTDITKSRRFIGIGPEYKELLLAVLLIQTSNNKAQKYICEKLGIKTIGTDMKIALKRPAFADGRLKELGVGSVDNFDSKTHYWGALGITKGFLDGLISCVKGEFSHSNLYDIERDTYHIPVNVKLFQKNFSKVEATKIFRQFDNLKTLDMLAGISIPIQLMSGIDAQISHFSDGQFQSVYIYSIAELFKDSNCITLLDEPDSFLHPKWQLDFLNQVFEITGTIAGNNHILMSSHSATTLCSLEEQKINLFTIVNSKVSCEKRTKKEVINELSNSFIQYSEDESKLLIDNAIRSSAKPVLFVEGPSDVSILNTAYAKLYPGKDIPILIQDAFDRGFIRTLLSRHEIFKTYSNKHFFALFDFDDAYEDWRKLGGEHKVTDIELGLCRKLTGKNAYAFLLPIPNNNLKEQVWDDSNDVEKIRPKPHFCIEHVFWGEQELDKWFLKDKETGIIKFKGDKHKVKFSTEVVPTLDARCFNPFLPIFEFIQSVAQEEALA